jgi:hypothetical protein
MTTQTISSRAHEAVAALEADDRDQASSNEWTEWTPAYRKHIGHMLDRIFIYNSVDNPQK